MIDPIVKKKAVLAAIGCSYGTLHRKIASGEFPPPLRLGEHSIGWRESTVSAYLDALQTATPSPCVPPHIKRGRKKLSLKLVAK